MNTKEQQILQPTCQMLKGQQQGLKYCIVFKGSLFFLNLCLVIQLFTGIHLKCQAIGISILIIYIATIKYNFPEPFMTYFFDKSTKLQKMFVAMTIILIFQIKYLSFITPGIFLVCYAFYFYQLIYSPSNQMREFQKNSLFISILVVVQWEFILLRLQGYIEYDWSNLISVMVVGMILLLLPMGMMTLYFLCNTPRGTQYDDQYQESNWYKNHRKATFLSIFIVYLGYLSIFVVLLQAYLNEQVYKYILLSIFALTVFQMLLYAFLFKRLVILFLGYDRFAERIVIRLKNGHFQSIDESSERKYIKDQHISQQFCYFCQQQANVVHKSCENMTLCFECYQEYVVIKKRNCFKCKSYYSNYDYYYICSRQKLRSSQNQSTRNVSKYLQQGQYISVIL